MSAALVVRSEEQGVITLTLNNPVAMNAMSEEMAVAFRGEVQQILSGAPPVAVVVTGAGRAFSAGGDLDMLERKISLSAAENVRRMLDFYWSFLGMLEIEAPLVAAINGHAIGAGCAVATACDYRLAVSGAKCGYTFSRLGLFPGMGSTFFVPRVVGVGQGSELLTSGRVFSSEEGVTLGLINKVVPPEQLGSAVTQIIAEYRKASPLVRRQLARALRPDKAALATALLREARYQAESYASKDFAEGVRALREKREPLFG